MKGYGLAIFSAIISFSTIAIAGHEISTTMGAPIGQMQQDGKSFEVKSGEAVLVTDESGVPVLNLPEIGVNDGDNSDNKSEEK